MGDVIPAFFYSVHSGLSGLFNVYLGLASQAVKTSAHSGCVDRSIGSRQQGLIIYDTATFAGVTLNL
jgi:hypothetical protein